MKTAYYNKAKDGETDTGFFRNQAGVTETRHSDIKSFLAEAGRDYYIARTPAVDTVDAVDWETSEGGVLTAQICQIPGRFDLRRSSDRKIVSPSTVTAATSPLSLMDIAEELSGFTEQGFASPEFVAEHKDGKMEILSLAMDGGGILDPSEWRARMVIVNPHGGTGKVQGKFIFDRIACSNQFATICGTAADIVIGHRCGKTQDHTTVTKSRFSLAVNTWERAKEQMREVSEKVDALMGVSFSEAEAGNFFDQIVGIKDGEKVSGQKTNQKDFLMEQFSNSNAGTYGKNAWDAYNAVTYLTTHGMPGSKVDDSQRFAGIVTPNGLGAKIENKASERLAALIS